MSENELDDEQLLGLLARALAATDPVPPHALASARETLSNAFFEAEMAELVFDSATEPLVGVRGADSARQVTFRAPGIEIEMMLMDEGTRRLVGQLVPAQTATIELRFEERIKETGTDRLGRFEFSDVPAGSVQLALTTESGAKVVTEWMVL